jgi:hypothetical protein
MFKQSSFLKFIAWFYLLGCVSASSAVADVALYYCPKGNVSLIADETQMHGTANEPFPLGPLIGYDAKRPQEGRLYWRLKDCSNPEFICYDAISNANIRRRLFVPRHPKLAQTYNYGSAKAYVLPSTTSSKLPTIQVVVWQSKQNEKFPVKFTIQKVRGAIFIDGLNFWNDADSTVGETCVLEAGKGIFKGISVPTTPTKEITDY